MSQLASYAQSLGVTLLTNNLYEFWNIPAAAIKRTSPDLNGTIDWWAYDVTLAATGTVDVHGQSTCVVISTVTVHDTEDPSCGVDGYCTVCSIPNPEGDES